MEWHTLHVVYYEPDNDALLLDGVRPLVRRLTGRVAAVSFDRHWRRGPQFRVHVRASAADLETVVRPAVAETVGAFLARHPSTHARDEAREHAAHERRAVLEAETGPLRPWYPDNSVHVTRREPPDGPLAALVADFHAGTNDLVFDLVAAARGRSRTAAGFDLMIATAHALSGAGIFRSFLSFRSHAEAFLCGYPEGAGLRPAWRRHSQRVTPALADRVGALVAGLDGTRPTPARVRDWVGALRPYRDRAVELIAADPAALPAGDEPGEHDLAALSPFHRRLFGHPGWARTRASTDFRVYRLMINLTYLTLTRAGVTPIERFLLCHLAADAVEARYGHSAFDLAGRSAGGAAPR